MHFITLHISSSVCTLFQLYTYLCTCLAWYHIVEFVSPVTLHGL
jgi:hypothetical protein